MSILENIANTSVSGALGLVEKVGFGMPLFKVFVTSSELLYNCASKLNFMNTPESRFDNYVLEYKKSHSQQTDERKPIAIVTGANCGIGYVTSKALVLVGYHVIFACRNELLATEAIAQMNKETGLESCEFIQLDLSSFDSIRAFVSQFKAKHTRLNILINNAGAMSSPETKTKEGIELNFGINHVGHFLLTTSLLDVLKVSAPARIIVVSSMSHYISEYNIDEIADPTGSNGLVCYSNSKLANIMFATTLAKKLEGAGVTVNSLHPGSIDTEITQYWNVDHITIAKRLKSMLFLGPVAGALTSIKLALSPELANVTGKYFANELEVKPLALSQDEAKCQELWDFTEDLIRKLSDK